MKTKQVLVGFLFASLLFGVAGCGKKNQVDSDIKKVNDDQNKETLVSLVTFDNDDDLYVAKDATNNNKYEISNFRNDVTANNFYENPSPAYRIESSVSGKALNFDGYSNYVSMGSPLKTSKTFSTNIWVGVRSFELNDPSRNITPVIEYYDRLSDSGFVFGYTTWGQYELKIKTSHGWEEVFSNTNLELYKWQNIGFSVSENSVSLYLNGKSNGSKDIGGVALSGQETMYIGRNTFAQNTNTFFPYNYLSGCVDEIRIYNSSIDNASHANLYNYYLNNGNHPSLSFKEMNFPSNYLNDNVYRTLWHGLPSMNWVSDTNGGFYYKGNYHLFFTKSDLGPELFGETWGHIVSPDMVHWHEVQPAITTENNDYDNRYVFAGSGAVINNIPYIFYSGFVLNQYTGYLNSVVSMARAKDLNDPDLEQWEKMPEVILRLPSGFKVDEFRDPQIYIEHDTAFLVVVSRTSSGNPVLLGYSAPLSNITNWSYRGVVFEVDYSIYKDAGYMWEVPIFLRLESPSGLVKYLFAQAPINEVGRSNDSIYFLGDFNWQTCRFVPDEMKVQRYDFGGDYFSCSGGEVFDPKLNQTILFETLQCCWNLSANHRYNSGYSAGFTMGRYYGLDNDGNVVVHHVDYSSTYGKKLLEIGSSNVSSLQDYYEVGRSYMLNYKFKINSENRKVGFEILSNKSGTESLSFYYDVRKKQFILDELKTSNPLTKYTSVMDYELPTNKEINIEVFVDQSCVEIFIDDARAMSARAYNNLNCKYIKPIGSSWDLTSLVSYEMKGVY